MHTHARIHTCLLLQDLVFVFSDFAPANTRAKDTVASPFACVQHLPGNRTAQRVCAAPGFKRRVVDFVQVQQASAFTQLRRPGQRAWQDARGTLSEGRPAVRKRVREPAAEAEIERMTWPRISSMLMSSPSSMADRNERLLIVCSVLMGQGSCIPTAGTFLTSTHGLYYSRTQCNPFYFEHLGLGPGEATENN
jgi:hypothetical protein